MSKLKFSLFLCFSFVSISAFSMGRSDVSHKIPDWVNSSSSAYPSSEYLTYAGEGAERKNAELDALRGLTAVFGQNATSATSSSRRLVEAESGGKVAFAQASAIDQEILQQVDHDDVIGLEFKEYFVDSKSGKNYALAVMNKAKTAQIYKDMMLKNQKVINELFDQIKSGDENTLQNYARLDFAEEIAERNEKYSNRLNVLNSSLYKEISPKISTKTFIHKKKLDMAEKIPICVFVTQDSDGRIAKTFQEIVSSLGFNSTLGSNERYKIEVKLNLTESSSSDGKTFFCEYTVEAALIDTFIGETIIPMTMSGREGSTTYQNAVVRSKQKIAAKAKGEFQKNFSEYLQNFAYFKD